jgi:fluoride exporter
MKNYVLVFIGSGIGGMMRFGLSSIIKWNGTSLPWATMFVNILGCAIIGFVLAIADRNATFSTQYKILLATGLCGGFTTFSALSAECLTLLRQQQFVLAAVYICCSIVLGLIACALNYYYWLTIKM